MRKILIAAIVVLFSMTATVHAQTAPAQPAAAEESGGPWRAVVIGVGALAGIWAVNVATAGFAAGPVFAVVGDMAAGEMTAGQVAAIPADMGMALVTNPWWTVARVTLIAGGAITGGYIGAWLYDG